MSRSITSQASGPSAVSRPKKTKWKRTSVRKQAEANRAVVVKRGAAKKRMRG